MRTTIIITIILLLLSPLIISIFIDITDSDESDVMEEFLLTKTKAENNKTGEENNKVYEDTKCKDSKTNIPKNE